MAGGARMLRARGLLWCWTRWASPAAKREFPGSLAVLHGHDLTTRGFVVVGHVFLGVEDGDGDEEGDEEECGDEDDAVEGAVPAEVHEVHGDESGLDDGDAEGDEDVEVSEVD